jgi:hypothetical protein
MGRSGRFNRREIPGTTFLSRPAQDSPEPPLIQGQVHARRRSGGVLDPGQIPEPPTPASPHELSIDRER